MAHGLALGVLLDVRVCVNGDADLAVPQDLHNNAGRDSGGSEGGQCHVERREAGSREGRRARRRE